jgi:ribosomal protein L7Ae-like RNA K-turn-binding protein
MINEKQKKRIYCFLGLIKKAGKLTAGEKKAEIAIKKGKDILTIIAEDASPNTKKKFEDMLIYRKRDYVVFGEKYDSGYSMGDSERAVIVILDKGFAEKFKELLKEAEI